MNLSLKLFLASIVGPCLLAFTVGYFSRPFVSSYHHYLALSINEAFKSSSLKIILPFVVHVSFHSDSANPERLQTIRWSHYLGESGSNPTEVPVNEKFQNDAAESAKTVSSGSQRVFVDLINLDSEFLNSEEMVETGFLTLVKQLRMKNFTYECHRRLSGKGVNCMGYAGQDSISVYTWPSLGVLSLNVLSSLHDPWGSAIPLAKEIFAVPIASPELNFREPCLTWSLKQRNTGKLSWMTYKPVPPNPSTAYDPSGIDSYETIDGVDIKPMSAPPLEVKNDTQRQQNYDIIYSEALVHPVMFAHDNPKIVAIVGNGTGSTLREVLKHKTVEKVVLVGSDSSVLQTSRKLFPQHSDCSTLKGSAQCCYDDARVEMISDETVEWLLGEEGDDGDVSPDDQFDVIIFEKNDSLWSSQDQLKMIFDNLSDMLSANGVLVIPHGVLGSNTERSVLETLVAVGFEAIHRYEEFVQLDLLSFIACFHNQESRALWFATAAEFHSMIQSRLTGTSTQSLPIVHWFDEATMMNYQLPSRIVEDSFCSQTETPYKCDEGHGFDPDIPNAPISSFAVGRSQIPGAGRGIFFQSDVAKGTFIAADESVYDILIYPSTTSLINEMVEFLDSSEFLHYSVLFYTYLFGYGFAFEYFGKPGYLVDTGILTFINHGCNGTAVMGEGEPLTSTEMTVDIEHMPPELNNYSTETHIYNPFIDRNNMRIITAGDKTLFDIKKGSELLDNYLRYLHEGNWKAGVLDYRAQCIASGKGVVTGYEERKSFNAGDEFHFHPPHDL